MQGFGSTLGAACRFPCKLRGGRGVDDAESAAAYKAAAARGVAERAAKRNPIPSLRAALKPVFKGSDVVSSSPLVPARVVQAFKAGVQDAGRVADFFKKQVVGDGSIVQNVTEGVSAVSEIAQSGASSEDSVDLVGEEPLLPL
jgi:hypothetical protein